MFERYTEKARRVILFARSEVNWALLLTQKSEVRSEVNWVLLLTQKSEVGSDRKLLQMREILLRVMLSLLTLVRTPATIAGHQSLLPCCTPMNRGPRPPRLLPQG
jgi:hypothetical protein